MGISETRNPKLANIFYRLKYVESFGTGIGRIIKSYETYDRNPTLQEADNAFLVILPNVNFKDVKKNIISINLTKQEQILEYLSKYKIISRVTVQEMFGISKTRANYILNEMLENELIVKQGRGKSITYRLK